MKEEGIESKPPKAHICFLCKLPVLDEMARIELSNDNWVHMDCAFEYDAYLRGGTNEAH